MPKLVNRSNPAGDLIDIDAATLDQVKNGNVVIERADGTNAVLGTVAQVIQGLVRDEVANLLRQKTIDLRYEGEETWVRATGNNNISSARGAFGANELNALTDWAVVYTIPSGVETTGEVVVRLDKGANPNDYRIVSSEAPVNVGDITPVGFVNSPTYDYYLITLTFVGGYAVGEMLTLEHHGTDPHTTYVGTVPGLAEAINDITEKASATDVATLTTEVARKQDIRPVDMDIDNHFYVRGNVRPVSYALELKNIVPSLLPSVNTIFVSIKGSPVHSESFDTSVADQVISVDLSGTELQNTNRNIRSDEDFIIFQVELRAGATAAYSEQIPIAVVDSPPVTPSREILPWNPSRANSETATLPTNYGGWQFCKMLLEQGGNTDTVLVQTTDLARGNLSNFGRGNNKFNWNATTRVLTPTGRNAANTPSFITVALL